MLAEGPCSGENRYCCGTGRTSREDCAPLPLRTVISKIWAWPPSAVTCRSPSVPLISQSRFVARERQIFEMTVRRDRKSTHLNSSHGYISYAVFCLKKKKKHTVTTPH